MSSFYLLKLLAYARIFSKGKEFPAFAQNNSQTHGQSFFNENNEKN
jgi:hypothetical protein